RTSRASRASTCSGATISASTPSAAWAKASARVGPHARTPTSASTSKCSQPAVIVTGTVSPVHSVGGPRRGALSAACRDSLHVAELALEDREERGAGGLRAQDARPDADDRPATRARGVDLPGGEPTLGPDEQMHARIGREAAGQARGECRSELTSLPRALPRWPDALPHAELELGGLVEGQDVDERAGRVHGRDAGAAALLRRLFRDPLPAARALAPAARLERDDRALREDRDHARHAELGRGADDPLHLVALRHRLDERDAQRGPRRARL